MAATPRASSAFLLLLLIAISAGVVIAGQGQVPTFRAGVDLVAVDVQVVTSEGTPVLGLTPEQFEVSINRRKRRVVSADLLNFDTMDPGPATSVRAPAFMLPNASPGEDGRVFILAFDAMSFTPGAAADILNAAQKFVESLQPADLVGIFAFPNQRPIELTTDRAAIVRDLGRALERADNPMSPMNRYQLMPSDIVDLTALRARDPLEPPRDVELVERIEQICRTDRDQIQCRRTVVPEAMALAAYEEAQVVQRLSALRSLLTGLSTSSRRKTIVLISTGILATDRAGGRPDLDDLGVVIGQDAARANATFYALHVDKRDSLTASMNRRPRPSDNALRDSQIVSRPLDQIAGASGGLLMNIAQGGTPQFERILREMSSYYLLGVEPDDVDRDGKPRSLTVKVNGRKGTTVRARSWVVIPRRALAN